MKWKHCGWGYCIKHGEYRTKIYYGCPTCVQILTYKGAGQTLVGLSIPKPPDTLAGINPAPFQFWRSTPAPTSTDLLTATNEDLRESMRVFFSEPTAGEWR